MALKSALDYLGSAPAEDYSTTLSGYQSLRDPRFIKDLREEAEAVGQFFKDDDQLVNEWLSKMRWGQTNTVSAVMRAGEALSAGSKQAERQRRLTTVFNNLPAFWQDGGTGWASGLKDYLPATVVDPTNLLSGPALKGVGLGAKTIGGAVVKGAAKQAMFDSGINAATGGVIAGANEIRDARYGLDDFSWGDVAMGALGDAVVGGVTGGLLGGAGAGAVRAIAGAPKAGASNAVKKASKKAAERLLGLPAPSTNYLPDGQDIIASGYLPGAPKEADLGPIIPNGPTPDSLEPGLAETRATPGADDPLGPIETKAPAQPVSVQAEETSPALADSLEPTNLDAPIEQQIDEDGLLGPVIPEEAGAPAPDAPVAPETPPTPEETASSLPEQDQSLSALKAIDELDDFLDNIPGSEDAKAYAMAMGVDPSAARNPKGKVTKASVNAVLSERFQAAKADGQKVRSKRDLPADQGVGDVLNDLEEVLRLASMGGTDGMMERAIKLAGAERYKGRTKTMRAVLAQRAKSLAEEPTPSDVGTLDGHLQEAMASQMLRSSQGKAASLAPDARRAPGPVGIDAIPETFGEALARAHEEGRPVPFVTTERTLTATVARTGEGKAKLVAVERPAGSHLWASPSTSYAADTLEVADALATKGANDLPAAVVNGSRAEEEISSLFTALDGEGDVDAILEKLASLSDEVSGSRANVASVPDAPHEDSVLVLVNKKTGQFRRVQDYALNDAAINQVMQGERGLFTLLGQGVSDKASARKALADWDAYYIPRKTPNDGASIEAAIQQADLVDPEASTLPSVVRTRAGNQTGAGEPIDIDAMIETLSTMDYRDVMQPGEADAVDWMLDGLSQHERTKAEIGIERRGAGQAAFLHTLFDNLSMDDLRLAGLMDDDGALDSRVFDALEASASMMERLFPQGYRRNNPSRAESIKSLTETIQALNPVGKQTSLGRRDKAEMADVFGRLLWSLGGDRSVGPRFAAVDKLVGGAEGGFTPTFHTNGIGSAGKSNAIEIATKSGAPSRQHEVLLHELAHWAFENVLTPRERIEWLRAMGDGEWRAVGGQYELPNGATRDLYLQEDLTFQELFATTFTDWARENRMPKGLDQNFFQKIAHKLAEIYNWFVGYGDADMRVTDEMIALFERILPDDQLGIVLRHQDLPKSKVPKKGLLRAIHSNFNVLDDLDQRMERAILTGDARDIVDVAQEYNAHLLHLARPKDGNPFTPLLPGNAKNARAFSANDLKEKRVSASASPLSLVHQRQAVLSLILNDPRIAEDIAGGMVSDDVLTAAGVSIEDLAKGNMVIMKASADPEDIAPLIADYYFNGPSGPLVSQFLTSDLVRARKAIDIEFKGKPKGEAWGLRSMGDILADLYNDSFRRGLVKDGGMTIDELKGTSIPGYTPRKLRQANQLAMVREDLGPDAPKGARGHVIISEYLDIYGGHSDAATPMVEPESLDTVGHARQLLMEQQVLDDDDIFDTPVFRDLYAGSGKSDDQVREQINQSIQEYVDDALQLSPEDPAQRLLDELDMELADTQDPATMMIIAKAMQRLNKMGVDKGAFTDLAPETSSPIMHAMGREKADTANGLAEQGIPANTSASVQAMLSKTTHRDQAVEGPMRAIGYRLLNADGSASVDMPLSEVEMARRLGLDPTGLSDDIPTEKSPVYNALRSMMRKVVAGLNKSGDMGESVSRVARFLANSRLFTASELDALSLAAKDSAINSDALSPTDWLASLVYDQKPVPVAQIKPEHRSLVGSARRKLADAVAYTISGNVTRPDFFRSYPELGLRMMGLTQRAEPPMLQGNDLPHFAAAMADDAFEHADKPVKEAAVEFARNSLGFDAASGNPIPVFMVRSGPNQSLGGGTYISMQPELHDYDALIDRADNKAAKAALIRLRALSKMEPTNAVIDASARAVAEARHYGVTLPASGEHAFTNIKSPFNAQDGSAYRLEDGAVQAILAKMVNRGGVTQKRIDDFIGALKYGRVSGRELLDAMSLALGRSKPNMRAATDLLAELGYDSVSFTRDGSGSLKARQTFKVFDQASLRNLSDLGQKAEATLVADEVSDVSEGLTGGLMRAMGANKDASASDVSIVRVAQNQQKRGASAQWANAVTAPLRKPGPTMNQAVEWLKNASMPSILAKNSTRMKKAGLNWVGTWFEKHFDERHVATAALLDEPLLALEAIDDTSRMSRFLKRDIYEPLRQFATRDFESGKGQPESFKRVVQALRRGGNMQMDRSELEAYTALRKMFETSLVQLNEAGVMVGYVPNYVPQIYNQDFIRGNREGFAQLLHRYYKLDGVDDAPYREELVQATLANILDESQGGLLLPGAGKRHYGKVAGPEAENIDNRRALRWDDVGLLDEVEKFLVNDPVALAVKYADQVGRRTTYVKRMGLREHALNDYLYVAERNSADAIAELLTKPKSFQKRVTRPDHSATNGFVNEVIEHDMFVPFPGGEKNAQTLGLAHAFAQRVIKEHAVSREGARQLLMGLTANSPSPVATLHFSHRVEAILGALDDFGPDAGRIDEGALKHMQGSLDVTKGLMQEGDTKSMRDVATVLKTANSVSLLGWTTLTSIPDLVLPLIRSGNMGAWIKGMSAMAGAADPETKLMLRKLAVNMDSVIYDQLMNMHGGGSQRLQKAFFNATLLSPWTRMNRRMAAVTGMTAFEHAQDVAYREFKQGVPFNQQSVKYRTAARTLHRYGLDEFLPDGTRNTMLGEVTDDPVVQQAVLKFTNNTEFAPSKDDIPLWAQTALGELVFQLKSFPLMMARLAGEVHQEALHGNFAPAFYLYTFGAGAGAASLAAKDIIQMRGGEDNREAALRDRQFSKSFIGKLLGAEEDLMSKNGDLPGWYLEGMLAMGGYGLIAEVIHGVASQAENGAYGETRIAGLLGGPTFSLGMAGVRVLGGAMDALGEGADNGRSKERAATREIITRIPILGGNRAVREGLVDTIAGEAMDRGSNRSGGDWNTSWGDGWGSGW